MDTEGNNTFLRRNSLATRAAKEEYMRLLDQLLEQQMKDCEVNMESLASQLYITRVQLNRKVKAITGLPMREYVKDLRIRKACAMLRNVGDGLQSPSVAEVARDCGFDDCSYFCRFFRKQTGMSPTAYMLAELVP